MDSRVTWKAKIAAGLFAVALIFTACSGDGDITETETETEIPGVDAPEVEVDG